VPGSCFRGIVDGVFEADVVAVLAREVLRERRAELIAETCAWAVGLSDRPHYQRRSGRVVPSGATLGERAGLGLPLSGDEDGRLELGDARPGSFQDALNALRPDGTVHADAFDDEVLEGFVRETCVQAAERARRTRPEAWRDLLDDLGGDDTQDPDGVDADDLDLTEVVRAGDWEGPLRIEAEQVVLAALAAVPLLEVEAEGLPLSMVRAAEAVTRAAVAPAAPPPVPDEALAGALFLAETALSGAGLGSPVPAAQAGRLLAALLDQGLEPEEVDQVLDRLPVEPETAAKTRALMADGGF
jgi:hypothetical protein